MKSTSGWENGRNGDNSSGFTVLPAGRNTGSYVGFYAKGTQLALWTSSPAIGIGAPWVILFHSEYNEVGSSDCKFSA